MQKAVAHQNPSGLGEQQSTLMDIDETESVATERSATKVYGEAIYAKSDEMTVSFYASLPVEVKQVLRNAGMLSSWPHSSSAHPYKIFSRIPILALLIQSLDLHSWLRRKPALCGNMSRYYILNF
jgi:hypothetical protein